MSKSQYSYPPDEFDVRGSEGSPIGVHREPRSGWSSVWPFLLVVVVCGGIAAGAVTFLSRDDDPSTPPAAEQSAGADSGDASQDSGDDASAEPSGEATDGEAEPSDDASEEPSDDASDAATELPGDPAAANLSARVVVYNDISGAEATGQAAAGQAALTDSGFTDVGAEDVPDALDDAYDESTVLYGKDRADTASAVAEAFGIDPANVTESDEVTASPTDAVWVVLKEPVS